MAALQLNFSANGSKEGDDKTQSLIKWARDVLFLIDLSLIWSNLVRVYIIANVELKFNFKFVVDIKLLTTF